MKKIKILLSAILMLPMVMSCNIEGINEDTVLETGTTTTASKIFDISTDNSGLVRITPLGTSIAKSVVNFGHGTGVAATANVASGQSATHVYPEGNYTVTITSYDIAGKETVTTYPLAVKYVAPTNLKVETSVAGYTATITPTANYAKGGYKIDFGDGSAAQTIADGKAATHVYSKAGDYTITVTALSGGAATSVSTTSVKVTNPLSLPVTFEDSETNYGTGGVFGGVSAEVITNPFKNGLNTTDNVWKFTKTEGAESWAGTWTPLAEPGGVPVNIDNGSKFTMLVYATETGKMLHFQLEGPSTDIGNQGIDVPVTVANQWHLITFDFSGLNIPAGTTFSQYVFQYNLADKGNGEIIYIDNITQTK